MILKRKRKTENERLNRVRRINREKALQRYRPSIEYLRHKDKKAKISVDAPSDFSILDNADEMLTFFAHVRRIGDDLKYSNKSTF